MKIQETAHNSIEHIVGNLKGGVIDPTTAVELLDQVVLDALNAMRYPGEPPLYRPEQTQTDRAMQQHFEHADKGK